MVRLLRWPRAAEDARSCPRAWERLRLREGQRAALEHLATKRDVLALLPFGSGKTLIPAIVGTAMWIEGARLRSLSGPSFADLVTMPRI